MSALAPFLLLRCLYFGMLLFAAVAPIGRASAWEFETRSLATVHWLSGLWKVTRRISPLSVSPLICCCCCAWRWGGGGGTSTPPSASSPHSSTTGPPFSVRAVRPVAEVPPPFFRDFGDFFRSVGAAASATASASEEIHARAAKLDALGSDPAGGTYAPRSLRPWLGAPPPPPPSQWG